MKFSVLFIALFFFIGCEEKIELPVKNSVPRLVIRGEIDNNFTHHTVQVQQTVPLPNSESFQPISGATIVVRELEGGRLFPYKEMEPGQYQSTQFFSGQIGYTYELEVQYAGKTYVARSKMPAMVPIDSIGVSKTTLFGDNQRFITIKFRDPAEVENYYRYLIRLNDGPFDFVRVYNDRFNDGNVVQHDLFGLELSLIPGDRVSVIRQYVDANTYHFWNSIQSNNPLEAAPSNPPTNISGGALGLFSAYSRTEFAVVIQNELQ
jgi:hypothetical protein